MLEWQRAECLEAMGLKILQPRFELPGAKPSAVLDADQFKQDPADVDAPAMRSADGILANLSPDIPPAAEKTEPAPATPESAPRTSNALDTLSGDKPESISSIKVSLGGATQTSKPLRFRLRLVTVGQLMMLLEQPTLEWMDEKAAMVFFRDIHYAVIRELPNQPFNQAQFDWPPAKHLNLPDDAVAAGEMLNGFVSEYLSQSHTRALMLWGSSISGHLLQQKLEIGAQGQLGELPVLQLATLADYWSEPMKKRELWLQAKKLMASLGTSAGATAE